MACRLRIDVLATTVLTIAACGLATAPVRTWLEPGSARAQMPNPCKGVAGRWDWFVGNNPASPEVTIRPDGTLTHGDRKGRWLCAEQRFVLVWDHGFTDVLSLSMDGGRLSGKNNVGASVSGEKIASVLPSPDDTAMDARPPAQSVPPPSSAPSPLRGRVLGMELAPLTNDLRRKFQINASVRSGLVVLGVDAGSPASAAGLGASNVIVEAAHSTVSSVDGLVAEVERQKTQMRQTILLLVSGVSGEKRFVALGLSGDAAPSSPPSVSSKPEAPVFPPEPPFAEFFKDFLERREAQSGQSSSPPPLSAQTGAWTTSWSRMEVTATLKAVGGDAKRGALGIRISSAEQLASLLLPALKHGVLVMTINSGSAVAGVMQRGDIVTAINGRAVRTASELSSMVGRNPAGAQIKVEFWRRSGGYPDLLAAVSRSAQTSHPTAFYLLGVFEGTQESGPADDKKAFAHYLRAAELGSVHGMVAVATAYRNGSGADKNPSEAARWYRQAVERSSATAMVGLATLIASGQIGEVNRAEVFRLMERAAKANHAIANYTIASYYNAGYGTARNPEAGARHLIEAIRHGGAEMMVRFSTEKTWQPSAEFIMALQQQLQAAKVYEGPIDGKRSPQMLTGLVQLYVESGQ